MYIRILSGWNCPSSCNESCLNSTTSRRDPNFALTRWTSFESRRIVRRESDHVSARRGAAAVLDWKNPWQQKRKLRRPCSRHWRPNNGGNFCDAPQMWELTMQKMSYDSQYMVYILIVFSPKIHGLLRLNPCTHCPNYDEIHVTLQFHPAFWKCDRNHSILTFDFHTFHPAHWFLCRCFCCAKKWRKRHFGGFPGPEDAEKSPSTKWPSHGSGHRCATKDKDERVWRGWIRLRRCVKTLGKTVGDPMFAVSKKVG